ncbi:DUF2244 domain-containing protein [Frigidibacter sp. SD6-1]|uniref:DUF2244 domain-containing protein n=1 Tax=Frigidibacter sp. SD6-1 TaxID=3032581 RepID=UPI0024E00285|nr:DUF2244 domain-containing protein [Frigidibacter sp. SD6-1]
MPYIWTSGPDEGSRALTLRPHRSLTPRGFVLFIGATAALFALPLLSLVGGAALWFVLAFAGLCLWAVWIAIARNSRAAGRGEVLTLTRDRITLIHALADPPRTWEANPYWVTVQLRPEGGPVAHYLTLKGNGREVELGAFLSPDERKALADELRAALAEVR